MKGISSGIFLFAILWLCIVGCREPFEPAVTEIDYQLLVVEGYLEVGSSGSKISLSRTTPIYSDIRALPVSNAIVEVEGTESGKWVFFQRFLGEYLLNDELPANQNYRVRITTPTAEYLSDEINPMDTPADMELNYERRDGGVSIYASTTGTENVRYFVWEYEEDWEYRSPYQNFYYYDSERRTVLSTPFSQIVLSCFQSDVSTRIILESADRFQGNRISKKEIQRIDSLSEKLGQRYSILVKQRAIDQDAFIFWDGMRKNSDDIGGIFSPLPSLINSNVNNLTNPEQPVIGYISAGQTIEKRMYIDSRDLGPWRVFIPEYQNCALDTVIRDDYNDYFVLNNYVPVLPVCDGPICTTYLSTTVNCTDCRLRGNANPPSFWEEYEF
ncbi:DUF4249 domain-containing protein [Lunatibacter salilacus]|uniref:DUF4249 domain-containing protein n=1 Tax=Lunatibacter salilacus TaxID=2483804 RepID=UPI00131C1A19|nr:DUF4249 domain-containing protein [Lunatibacter salilacus]